uniref:Putative ovule protein n=1 Tax=Solanum chacoense TaxID=4108 RepID=A0A0V0H3N7_SOLCH
MKKQINTLQHVKQSSTIISHCKTFYLKQSQNLRYACFTGSQTTVLWCSITKSHLIFVSSHVSEF